MQTRRESKSCRHASPQEPLTSRLSRTKQGSAPISMPDPGLPEHSGRPQSGGALMFRCERCRRSFTNSEARTLEYCPICQEAGEQAPLALKIFVGPLTEHVERTRQAVRELGGRPRQVRPRGSTVVLASKLPAPAGRSTGISEGKRAGA